MALDTNDIDFRARLHSSASEADFLAARVAAGRGPGRRRRHVPVSGAQPPRCCWWGSRSEEEAPGVSCGCARRGASTAADLLRRAVRHQGPDQGGRDAAGGRARHGDRVARRPRVRHRARRPGSRRREAPSAPRAPSSWPGSGSRACPGASRPPPCGWASATVPAGWIPRWPGARRAVGGRHLSLLPGGRPPPTRGPARRRPSPGGCASCRTATAGHRQILEAASHRRAGRAAGRRRGRRRPASTRSAREALDAAFVVTLSCARRGHRRADVVLPVAAVAESRHLLNWEGRVRMFEAALKPDQMTRPLPPADARVLHMLADAMDVHFGLPDPPSVRREMDRLGARSGAAGDPSEAARPLPRAGEGEACWPATGCCSTGGGSRRATRPWPHPARRVARLSAATARRAVSRTASCLRSAALRRGALPLRVTSRTARPGRVAAAQLGRGRRAVRHRDGAGPAGPHRSRRGRPGRRGRTGPGGITRLTRLFEPVGGASVNPALLAAEDLSMFGRDPGGSWSSRRSSASPSSWSRS